MVGFRWFRRFRRKLLRNSTIGSLTYLLSSRLGLFNDGFYPFSARVIRVASQLLWFFAHAVNRHCWWLPNLFQPLLGAMLYRWLLLNRPIKGLPLFRSRALVNYRPGFDRYKLCFNKLGLAGRGGAPSPTLETLVGMALHRITASGVCSYAWLFDL